MKVPLTVNVAAFTKGSTVVGPGSRDAIWVQGCSIRCKGCHNAAYLPHEPRRIISVRRFLSHFRTRVGRIDGVSIIGGEPTEQARPVAALLEGVRGLGLSTVVFTGRHLQDLLQDPDPGIQRMLRATDLLIDGPFVEAEHDPSLHWRGSRNQRLLYLTPRLAGREPEDAFANGEIVIGSEHVVFNGIGAPDELGRRGPSRG